jgi:hypothetical protein
MPPHPRGTRTSAPCGCRLVGVTVEEPSLTAEDLQVADPSERLLDALEPGGRRLVRQPAPDLQTRPQHTLDREDHRATER